MKYDFDRVIDRRDTACEKYSFLKKHGLDEDVLPMWVADMDFETVPEIKERLRQITEHGIYGYTGRTDAYNEAVISWFSRRFQWKIEDRWIISTPGVVFALATAVRTYTEPGDGILIQQPVYYPFERVISRNGRVPVISRLIGGTEQYEMDFIDMERKIREQNVKMMILCSPHNPVGRVWKKEELEQLGTLCETYGVTVVVDEIHCDFVRKGYKHVPFGTLEHFGKKAVICTAPSKTFNLAGLQASNIIIADPVLRRKFVTELNAQGMFGAGLYGLTACQTAYETGEEWLEQLLDYLEGNYQYIKTYLQEKLPKVRLTELQGTYLIWMDFRAYGYTDQELNRIMQKEAKLWLDDGPMFGQGGSGFMRLNLAAPKSLVEDAMERLYHAFGQL